MNSERICFSSKTIEISENENYLELTNRVCFYDEPNLNNVKLPFNDDSIIKANTLVDMPVVAKYSTNPNGEPTFKGHEVYYDEDGNMYFGTDNIGTHQSVYIENDNVEVGMNGIVKNLPCLFAKYRIWKRNQNVVDAVKRLYSEGKLYSSWEIQTLAYTYENGIKTLTDYVFLSNCLLGYEYTFPAYGVDAKAVQMSQKESQLLVAEAFSKDIIEQSVTNKENDKKEDEKLAENIENKDEAVSGDAETTVANTVDNEAEKETSTMTEFDLRTALYRAISAKMNIGQWDFLIVYNFPTDGVVWIQLWDAESELDVIQFTYTVENDVVTMSEPVDAKLTVSVNQINETVAEMNAKIDSLNSSIVEASAKIQEANKQIAELTPFKEAADIAEQARIEAETATKRKSLKAYASKSGLISDEEFSSDETIKNCIENVDEAGIKAIIAERFVASLDKNENVVETSQAENVDSNEVEQAQARTNLTDTDDESGVDYKAVMSAFLKK